MTRPVIDKSTSPLYGQSAGCPTAVACQILKQMCPDVTEMVNMDAGGSAEMMLFGKIINTTTEGTPRAVACGWLVEAVGEEDNEVVSIAFDLHRLDAPVYSSVKPRILGYNRIGELVDEDVQGFTLTCDGSIGTTSGSTFIAGGDPATGTLTATLGNMTATVPVCIMAAQPAIALRPILIDNRDYPIEVTATVNQNTYFYNPAMLDWNVADTGVANVTDGVLKGVANGQTLIDCSIGGFNDSDTVNVEISSEPYLYQKWDGWTLKGAGAKNIVIDETTGDVTFTYSSNRAPYLQMSKDVTFYSLPDSVVLVFNSTMPIDYIQMDARNRYYTTSHFLRMDPPEGEMFQVGQDYRIMLDLNALGGAENVGTFPVTVKSIKFTLNKGGETGEHTLSLKSFYSHYANTGGQHIPGDVNVDGEVNIADINAIIGVILFGKPTEGDADVNNDTDVNIADVNAVINIILSSSK